MNAAYVFRVEFRLDPEGATIAPDRFETTMELPANEPGTDGWLFFRDRLWRGGSATNRRSGGWRATVSVSRSSPPTSENSRTDEAFLDALQSAIAADLDRFNADSVDEVLHKYLGSSVHVREGDVPHATVSLATPQRTYQSAAY